MAKKELQWMPFLGQYLTASGAVFLNRSNNKDAVTALAAAGQQLKDRGVCPVTFTPSIPACAH